MIKDVIYMARSHVRDLPLPNILEVQGHAAISIHNPGKIPPVYSYLVAPQIHLAFNDITIGCGSDKYTLFDKLIAERIVFFLNAIEIEAKPYTIYINCETGVSISAAIARFIKAARPMVETKGLAINHTEFHNRLVLELLTKEWIDQLAKDATKRMNHV